MSNIAMLNLVQEILKICEKALCFEEVSSMVRNSVYQLKFIKWNF